MEILARNWWAVALRGAAGMIFGIITFLMPGASLAALVLLFGAYAIVDGVFNIVSALRGAGQEQPWWLLLIEGVVGIGAGVVTFALPGLTALVLVYVVAAWAILTGALEIAAAARLRSELRGEWLLAVAGVLSVVFGVLMMVAPAAGALALVLWIGAYAFLFGALLLILGLRLRRLARGEEFPLRRAA
jgi:uncharacterized membrane protein HdeD (DUF308 family)